MRNNGFKGWSLLFLGLALLSACGDEEGTPIASSTEPQPAPADLVTVESFETLAQFHLGDSKPSVRIALKRYVHPQALVPEREPLILLPGATQNHLIFDIHPDYSLARTLANEGYEVWLVDWRGRGDSWKGVAEKEGDPACRDVKEVFLREGCWSIDDFIHKDLPAVLQFVRDFTQAEHAILVGYSEGGTVALGYLGYVATLRANPEKAIQDLATHYQDGFISGMIGLAPALVVGEMDVDQSYADFPLQKLITWASQNFVENRFLLALAPNDVYLPFENLLNQFTLKLMDLALIPQGEDKITIEQAFLEKFLWSPTNIDPEVADAILLKNVEGMTAGELRQFGYGADPELENPGMQSLEDSDFTQANGGVQFHYLNALSAITLPVLFVVGDQDGVVSPINVELQYNQLPEGIDKWLEPAIPETGHVDLPTGLNAKTEVYPLILDWLSQHTLGYL